MKKLFFTALVAVVAVGGAYAQSYYSAGSNTRNIICEDTQVNCAVKYDQEIAYTVPFSSGNQGQPGTIVDLTLLSAEL